MAHVLSSHDRHQVQVCNMAGKSVGCTGYKGTHGMLVLIKNLVMTTDQPLAEAENHYTF